MEFIQVTPDVYKNVNDLELLQDNAQRVAKLRREGSTIIVNEGSPSQYEGMNSYEQLNFENYLEYALGIGDNYEGGGLIAFFEGYKDYFSLARRGYTPTIIRAMSSRTKPTGSGSSSSATLKPYSKSTAGKMSTAELKKQWEERLKRFEAQGKSPFSVVKPDANINTRVTPLYPDWNDYFNYRWHYLYRTDPDGRDQRSRQIDGFYALSKDEKMKQQTGHSWHGLWMMEKGYIARDPRSWVAKTGEKIGNTLADVVLAPLLPFKGLMKKALEKRGYKPSNKLRELAEQFYNHVVKNNFEGNNYDDVYVSADNYEDEDHAAIAIGAIVSAILAFIKGIKEKGDSGEPLSGTEKAIYQGTQEAETQIQDRAKLEASAAVGESILFDKNTQLVIIGGLALIIVWPLISKAIK